MTAVCSLCDWQGISRGLGTHLWQAHPDADPLPILIHAHTPVGDPDDCWEWTGSRHPSGYAQARVKGRLFQISRVLLGIEDRDYLEVQACHHCDNPPCVNPAHLFAGSIADNIRDMRAKGRANDPRGEASGRARFTEPEVIAIRQAHRRGEPPWKIARRYDAPYGTIYSIVSGLSWRHVMEESS